MNNNMIALQNYIDEMNAAFDARMKAEGATFWTSFALTADDLFNWYGIGSVEEFKQWMADNDAAEAEKEARKASYYVSDYDQALIDAKEDRKASYNDDFNYVGSTSHY